MYEPNKNDAPRYDPREALTILDRERDRARPDSEERVRAARQLALELLQLDGKADFAVSRALPPTTGVWVFFPDVREGVRVFAERGSIWFKKESEFQVHGLRKTLHYSFTSDRLASDERDDSVVPTPGEPLPTRSPLALVVERALQVARGEVAEADGTSE